MKNAFMDINHETAMMLWKKRYGKSDKVIDFAGREICKGAYNNRNSKYGWNLDHILPQSQGGKDTESNLICCHIKTNDEKANKYPVFNSNDKVFEIKKVQNHYEIKEKKPTNKHEDNNHTNKHEDNNESINFFDHSEGIRFINSCKNKEYFVATVDIKINNVKEKAILEFIYEIFKDNDVFISKTSNYFGVDYVVNITINDVPTMDIINSILEDCVLLNTYFYYYFRRHNMIDDYYIVYNLYCLNDFEEYCNFEHNSNFKNINTIQINELVRYNSDAKKDIKYINNCDSYEYDYYFTKLKNNLEREEDK